MMVSAVVLVLVDDDSSDGSGVDVLGGEVERRLGDELAGMDGVEWTEMDETSSKVTSGWRGNGADPRIPRDASHESSLVVT